MPISNGEQSPTSETFTAPDNRTVEIDETAQLELAKMRFIEVAATEGPDSEIAIGAMRAYHGLLQILADKRENGRELWLCQEIYNIFVKANETNPAYRAMVDSAREDLGMVQ